MDYRPLGQTKIQVSPLCLGTMTWGEQNTEKQAHRQLDYAFERGINFIDMAEMYPVPPREETFTRTETIVGRWPKLKTHRDKIVLATKVAGKTSAMPYIREGRACLDKKNIQEAMEGSLKRLGVDFFDLYQLHWPDRAVNNFGKLGYSYPPKIEGPSFLETLQALKELGPKARAFGLSNETPFGVMSYLAVAEKHGLPRMETIQNPYNLLNRTYEIGLSEITHREGVGLLAYSPMAFGVLSGKYLGGARPPGARLTLFKRFGRYTNERATRATEAYTKLALKHGLSGAKLALAFVATRPFVASTIIGATTMEQLKENIDSLQVPLSEPLLQEIEAIHQDNPNPAP